MILRPIQTGFAVALSLVLAGLSVFAADDRGPTDDALLQGAASRIDEHRKADGVLIVVDGSGNPIPGAQVTIEQTRHAFLFGCNIFLFNRVGEPGDETAYRNQFAELFNFATLGFYWPSYERRQGEPQHDHASQVAQWCKQHGITTKGHPLAWNFADPSWLPDDVGQIRTLQMARIRDCVERFRGTIDVWDVVNEATHFERAEFARNSPKLTRMWTETGRIEFVDECFRTARAASASATLLINDYRVDPAYAELIDQLTQKAGQRPFDVIGIQSHMHRDVWSNRRLWEACERFARFGVPLHFTELTVLSGEPGWEKPRAPGSWPSTPDGERQQQEAVSRIYTMLFSHPSVTAITWWDFSDRNAWQGAPAGLVREDLTPKPAYTALKELVKNQWWTRLTQTADADGRVTFRGFLGDYRASARVGEGEVVELQFTLAKNDANEQRIVIGTGAPRND